MALVESALSLVDVRTALLALGVFLALFWLLRRPSNLPPGPWAWPLLGSLPALARSRGQPHEALLALARRYGPVYSLTLFGQRVVVVHGYQAIRAAFQHPHLSDRPVLHSVKDILDGSEGVAAASGQIWREQRKLSVNVFKNIGVGKSSFEEQISAEAGHLVQELRGRGGAALDPAPLLMAAVSDIIASVVYGKRFEYSDPQFRGLLACIHRNMELIGAGAAWQFHPITRYLGFLPTMREMKRNMLTTIGFTQSILQRHLSRFDAADKRDFMDMYIGEMEENARQGVESVLSTSNLVSVINDLFVAGTETTATTLRWALVYMVRHPAVQERVQAEIDAAVGRSRPPALSHRPDLPFTEAVILEIQRVSNIVPLGVPHRASRDARLLGYTIPKDSFVVANHWALDRDPTIFDRPDAFDPERFLNADGEVVKPEEFIPFSTGRRVCLGEQLAKMELFIFFTYLLHQFTFKVPEGSPMPSLEGHLGITLGPKHYQICAVPR